jgi:hypothetical protein
MATFRVAALAALFVGSSILAEQAQGCDSNYPWLCKPVPPVEAAKPASKPRPAVKTPKPATEHVTRKEKRDAQKEAARPEVLPTPSLPSEGPAVAPIPSKEQSAIEVAPQSVTTPNKDFPPAQTLERSAAVGATSSQSSTAHRGHETTWSGRGFPPTQMLE